MAKAKSYTIKESTYGVAIATGAAVQVAKFNVAGYEKFQITVRSSATAVVAYSVKSAPKDESALYTNITSTSVAAGSSVSVAKSTITNNQEAWVTVFASSTATIQANALTIIFSAIEE